MVLRCTEKLLRRLPAIGKETSHACGATLLGDWYGHLLSINRRRLVLLISEHSRLPVLLPARDLAHLPWHLAGSLSRILATMPISAHKIRDEIAAMQGAPFGPTASRSLLGTINDFAYALHWEINGTSDDELFMAALKLSKTLVGPLAYRNPREVTIGLLADAKRA